MFSFIVRDCNGEWFTKECSNRSEAYKYAYDNAFEFFEDKLEIMLILMNGVCIYSSLTSPGITWEELTGWLA